MNHPWSDDDNLIAYYLYCFGDADLSVNKKALSDILGMTLGSLSYKIGNFKAIDGLGNLDGYSLQAVRTYKQYHTLPDAQVKISAEEAILRAMEKYTAELKVRLAQQRKS
jgi:hypothetical protein